MTKSSLDIRRVTAAMDQAEAHRDALQKGWTQTSSVARLARSWWSRDYKEVPWRSIALGVFAMLYLLNPLDVIPDPIPILGALDDATIFGFLFASLRADVKAFEKWELGQLAAPAEDADVVDIEAVEVEAR